MSSPDIDQALENAGLQDYSSIPEKKVVDKNYYSGGPLDKYLFQLTGDTQFRLPPLHEHCKCQMIPVEHDEQIPLFYWILDIDACETCRYQAQIYNQALTMYLTDQAQKADDEEDTTMPIPEKDTLDDMLDDENSDILDNDENINTDIADNSDDNLITNTPTEIPSSEELIAPQNIMPNEPIAVPAPVGESGLPPTTPVSTEDIEDTIEDMQMEQQTQDMKLQNIKQKMRTKPFKSYI